MMPRFGRTLSVGGSGEPSLLDVAMADRAALSSGARFYVMDGLRGIAALMVVLLHSFRDGGYVPNGQLAVDLFFILSGFVIAYSYDAKLARGMSVRAFLARRFIRLYPMLFLGAVGGVAIALVHNHTSPADRYPLNAVASSGGLSLAVLPYLVPGSINDKAFSFNPPIWSLFFEIYANVAYAVFRRILSVPLLIVLVAGSLVAIAYIGPLGGGGKSMLVGDIPRVIAGFFGGVLLFKLWAARRLPAISGSFAVLGAIIVAIFCLPAVIGGLAYAPTYAVLWCVVLAAANALPSRSAGIATFLGEASYPIYLIHWLTLYVATFIGAKLALVGASYSMIVIAHLAAMPVIGFVLFHYYEKPVMVMLKSFLLAKNDGTPTSISSDREAKH